MAQLRAILLRTGIGALCLLGSVVGGMSNNWLVASTSVVIGLCCIAIASAPAKEAKPEVVKPERQLVKQKAKEVGMSLVGSDAERLAAALIEKDRYALLMRGELFSSLSDAAKEGAADALLDNMQYVATGPIAFATNVYGLTGDVRYEVVEIPSFYIDRFPVTNVEYQRFMEAGGYDDESLWAREALVMMGSFKDKTGKRGPRFWENSTFASGHDLHPVVGVSWYEAAAYAKWVGKRLLKDPEWVRAATVAGVVSLDTSGIGARTTAEEDSFSWSIGRFANSTISIDEIPPGSGGEGVHHLLGNVWQWTDDDFGMWEEPANRLETDFKMKYLRGTAFDTYYDSESPASFLSADGLSARKHNVGFRCAISETDIADSLSQLSITGETKHD